MSAPARELREEHRREEAAAGLLRATMPAPDRSFTAEVMARLPAAGRPGRRAARVWWRALPAAAGIAAAALWIAGPRVLGEREHIAARGGGGAGEETPARPLPRLLGYELFDHGQARFSFTVRNLSGRPFHVMLFGMDAAGEVHWFYPAWTDASADPASVQVPADARVLPLPEGVTAANPAPGDMRVVGLFTEAPQRVREVEARLARGGLDALEGEVLQVERVPIR